jgi:5-carboxymethyl-2-hydroxymuconate isomerase
MLSGRTCEQKKRLSHLVLESLTQFSLKDVSFSVEVCDMDRDTYAKKVVHSE